MGTAEFVIWPFELVDCQETFGATHHLIALGTQHFARWMVDCLWCGSVATGAGPWNPITNRWLGVCRRRFVGVDIEVGDIQSLTLLVGEDLHTRFKPFHAPH